MILETIVYAIVLGIGAQVLAEKLRLPAILPLLVLGIAAGPYALGLLHPEALGEGLEIFVELGVAIILFEGGLSLDLGRLVRVGGAVRNLLTLGVAVTGLLAAWLAQSVTGMPWPTAALFGAIVTVTGPTVIVPLLRHMIAPREVKTVLVSEGLIVDPLGAVLAYLVLQWIQRPGVPLRPLAEEVLILGATGVILGFVAGSLGKAVARSRLAGKELRNLVILALVLLCFALSEQRAPQSGILAAMVMGFTMSAAAIPDLEAVRTFKEQLTTLFISLLFVLLSAQLDLGAVARLGWAGLLVAAGLVLVVRPAAVVASVWPGQLDGRGRTVLALTAPRGIVAAAVASLAARSLSREGMAGGPELEGLVYLAILVTGSWATLMAMALPRWLGYSRDPSRRLTVLVGAHGLSRALAEALGRQGKRSIVVDSSRTKIKELRGHGVSGAVGDARSAEVYEQAQVERDTTFVALTPNDELNMLAAELVREEFGVEHPVVALQQPSEEFGTRRRAWMDLLGGRAVDLPSWIHRIEAGAASMLTLDLSAGDARETLDELRTELAEEIALVCVWTNHTPSFRVTGQEVERLTRVTVLVAEGEARDRLLPFSAERQSASGEDSHAPRGAGGEAGSPPPSTPPPG